MHDDDVLTTPEQVARLVADQHPQWAGLPVTPVTEHGTDHLLYRLGDDLVARMPRVGWAAEQAERDARWLPRLAGRVPVDLPVPLALGEPGAGYPFRWSIAPWLPGAPPDGATIEALALAEQLGDFVVALHAVDASEGPARPPGSRGTPLRHWDDSVREAIGSAGDRIDGPAALRAWEHCLEAPEYDGPGVWIHGDLLAGNLLVHEGRLSAVIDFGPLAVADPAPDLQPFWTTLAPEAREVFRARVGYDDATWRRGRGWALGPALTGIPYYWDRAPAFARRGLRTLDRVLEDLGLR